MLFPPRSSCSGGALADPLRLPAEPSRPRTRRAVRAWLGSSRSPPAVIPGSHRAAEAPAWSGASQAGRAIQLANLFEPSSPGPTAGDPSPARSSTARSRRLAEAGGHAGGVQDRLRVRSMTRAPETGAGTPAHHRFGCKERPAQGPRARFAYPRRLQTPPRTAISPCRSSQRGWDPPGQPPGSPYVRADVPRLDAGPGTSRAASIRRAGARFGRACPPRVTRSRVPRRSS